MKIYLNLIFITFLFYVNADENGWADTPISEFIEILQSSNINNARDYIQFLSNEGKDLGFPSLKEITLIHPKWNWDDLSKGAKNNTQGSTSVLSKNHDSSFMKYESFTLLMEMEDIHDDTSYQLWYEENRNISNVPKFPEEAYPEFNIWQVLQEPQQKTIPQPKTKLN